MTTRLGLLSRTIWASSRSECAVFAPQTRFFKVMRSVVASVTRHRARQRHYSSQEVASMSPAPWAEIITRSDAAARHNKACPPSTRSSTILRLLDHA